MYWILHTCTHVVLCHSCFCLCSMRGTHVRHTCDTCGSFKLWVICTVIVTKGYYSRKYGSFLLVPPGSVTTTVSASKLLSVGLLMTIAYFSVRDYT